MSLYMVQNGQIVEAATGRVVNLSDEQAWLDRKDSHPEPSRSMSRMIDLIVRESKYQSRMG